MLQVIECVGHPRDLGFSQGRALRPLVRERVAEEGLSLRRSRWPSLYPFVKGPVRGRGAAREVVRHFTHLAERVDGLARGADLPVDSLFRLQGERGQVDGEVIALSAAGLDGDSGEMLARGLPGSDWVVRRSRPEVGFESLELTHAWSVTSVAGINQASLAACMVSHTGRIETGTGEASLPSTHLLVQECLQRFADVEAGIDWCSHRPASGRASLWLADASGRRAFIRFDGQRVSAVCDPQGAHVVGAADRFTAPLKETLESEARLDEKLLSQVLESQQASAYVRLVCSRRRLEVRSVAGPDEVLCLELDPPA